MANQKILDMLYLIIFSAILISSGATSTHIYGLDAGLYIGVPSVISGFAISYFLRDIRLALIAVVLTVTVLAIILSIIYSLPALICIIGEEALKNAFIFMSIKRAAYDILVVMILIIPSVLALYLVLGD